MKIGQLPDSRPPGGKTGLSKAGQNTSSAPTTGSAPAGEGVPVTVSSVAQAARASSTGDVDMVKVESVRSAIANGSYKVNPEAIADKLLANAKEMFQRPQH